MSRRRGWNVASGILPDSKAGFQPPGITLTTSRTAPNPLMLGLLLPAFPPGWKPRLTGRQDARRRGNDPTAAGPSQVIETPCGPTRLSGTVSLRIPLAHLHKASKTTQIEKALLGLSPAS